MRQFRVQGVVRCGQVFVSPPLDLPEGITVIVTDGVRNADEWKLKVLTALKRLDLLGDPDWDATINAEKAANRERLMRELERIAAERARASEPKS